MRAYHQMVLLATTRRLGHIMDYLLAGPGRRGRARPLQDPLAGIGRQYAVVPVFARGDDVPCTFLPASPVNPTSSLRLLTLSTAGILPPARVVS